LTVWNHVVLFASKKYVTNKCSVADPGCLSRISDPGSRISDLKTATKERGEQFFLHTF
jgi:hypothetical protein